LTLLKRRSNARKKQRDFYGSKKTCHTLKYQIAIDQKTGQNLATAFASGVSFPASFLRRVGLTALAPDERPPVLHARIYIERDRQNRLTPRRGRRIRGLTVARSGRLFLSLYPWIPGYQPIRSTD
jgi:hypothetical protein